MPLQIYVNGNTAISPRVHFCFYCLIEVSNQNLIMYYFYILLMFIDHDVAACANNGYNITSNLHHATSITSKEKHSLTRKFVGYRNWRQWWCKKEGNKVLRQW